MAKKKAKKVKKVEKKKKEFDISEKNLNKIMNETEKKMQKMVGM